MDTEIQTRFAALRAGSQTVPEISTAFSLGQRQAKEMDERPEPTMYKSPEEIQKGASELIQRFENEKKVQEELAEKYKKINPFQIQAKTDFGQTKGSSAGIQTTFPKKINMGSVPERPYLGLDGHPKSNTDSNFDNTIW